MIWVGALIFVAALLYSCVGHAGASGYLAVMALAGVAQPVLKSTALTLNIAVALIATVQFARAGAFKWNLFWPFALASVPAAFVGGHVQLPGALYRAILAFALLVAAVRLVVAWPERPVRRLSVPIALLCGGVIGLLSGMVGVGGGIFLSPLILLVGWADIRTTAGVSAAFILVNSVAGLAGDVRESGTIPSVAPLWAVAAVIGGSLGSYLGSRRLSLPALRRVLALVLVVAAAKLCLTREPARRESPRVEPQAERQVVEALVRPTVRRGADGSRGLGSG